MKQGEEVGLEELWLRSVRASHDFLSEEDIAGIRPEVGKALRRLDTLVAEVDGVPAGFMMLRETMIEALFIDPAAMGRGLGTEFIEYATACFPGRTLRVDVNEENASAAGFYLARGFKRAGRSATDSAGRPFPILHLERLAGEATA